MRRYFVFGTAAAVLMLSSIGGTAISVAFPVIIESFDISIIMAGWTLSAYQLSVTATIPLAGKISDGLGRKRAFFGFVSLFAVGSLLCSLAQNAPSLIVFRLIQGIGGSGFLPSAAGIAADEFPHSRQKAVGLLSSIIPIGWIVGPNLGGWMTTVFGWRSIFWINIPLCIMALVASAIFLHEEQKRETQIDLIGAGLVAGTVCGFMSGLSLVGNSEGPTLWVPAVLMIGAGVASLVLFWRRQSRVKFPVIEPEVLRGKPFVASNFYNFMFGCQFGAITLIPLYAVSIYGMSTLESGLILTPRSIGMIACAAVVSFSLVRWGYRRPMSLGTIILAPAFVLLALEPENPAMFGSSNMLFLLVVMGVLGIASGMVGPAANNACIELMPHRVATITAIRSMFRQIGQIFIITIGSLLLHNYGIGPGFRIFFFRTFGDDITDNVTGCLCDAGVPFGCAEGQTMGAASSLKILADSRINRDAPPNTREEQDCTCEPLAERMLRGLSSQSKAVNQSEKYRRGLLRSL